MTTKQLVSVRVDPGLWRKARVLALERGVSLASVVEGLVVDWVAKESAAGAFVESRPVVVSGRARAMVTRAAMRSLGHPMTDGSTTAANGVRPAAQLSEPERQRLVGGTWAEPEKHWTPDD